MIFFGKSRIGSLAPWGSTIFLANREFGSLAPWGSTVFWEIENWQLSPVGLDGFLGNRELAT
jgi:hypothetical protein